jgi:hypothetical protein
MRWILLGLLVLGFAAACGRVSTGEVETADDLVAALRGAGVEVEVVGECEAGGFGVVGQALRVGAVEVWAYEYNDQAGREAVSATIDRDGQIAGSTPINWTSRPNLWAKGRLIVVYDGTDGGTIVLLSGLLGDSLTVEAPPVDEPYPPAVAAAIGALAEELGLNPGMIDVVGFETVDWPDACLGLPVEQEICAAGVTPGWRIVLRAGDMEYELHTDSLGERIRR